MRRKMETMPVKPLITGVAGLALLVPASYFSIELLQRVLWGTTVRYEAIAQGFQRNAFHFYSFHGSQLILYGPLLTTLLNVSTVWRLRIGRVEGILECELSYRRYWLNAAIAMQAALLFLVTLGYLMVEHFRY
jgi:hypothetical protein